MLQVIEVDVSVAVVAVAVVVVVVVVVVVDDVCTVEEHSLTSALHSFLLCFESEALKMNSLPHFAQLCSLMWL